MRMPVLDRLVDGIEGVVYLFSNAVKHSLNSYCDLETADDDYTLVTHSGDLVSAIQILGTRNILGQEEFETITNGFSQALQSYFGYGGHAIQFYFIRDKESIGREIDRILRPSMETAKRLHLDIEDIFHDRKEAISSYCAHEACYLVLRTRIDVLNKIEKKRALAEQKEIYKKSIPNEFGQDPIRVISAIRERHKSFVSAVYTDLGQYGLNVSKVEVHDFCREIRMSIDQEFTDHDWKPWLPGDPFPIRAPSLRNEKDVSPFLWPKLNVQLIPRGAEIVDTEYVRIGNRIYGSVYVDLPPRNPQPFRSLFNRLIESDIPWRISFLIESGGLQSIKLKALAAAILSFSNSGNELIARAEEEMKERVMQGMADIKLRIMLSTWGASDNIKLLRSRVAYLARAVEGWGGCDVSMATGDPVEGMLSSALAVNSKSIATPAVAPLNEAAIMLPLTRPSSPWSCGADIFRTEDGKIWPYQPGSSQQTTWIDLVFASPGSGKSVLLNKSNLALCLAPGIKRLPRIAIIDIGPSSSGLIQVLQDSLPHDQKHLAAYHRLQMTKDYAINPFDTFLGCRFPIPQHRAYLVNLLLLLATPLGHTSSYDGMSDLVGLVVDEVYKKTSDDIQPKLYSTGIDEDVDAKLIDLGMQIDRKTSWWEVVDFLFSNGEEHLALRAQRFAVPTLDDVVEVSRSETVRTIYGDMKAPTGEYLIDAFGRMISSSIREYPILAIPTRFDIGSSRVVSLDLDEVAKTGGDAADRQTAIMYMLARHILAKEFYLTESILEMVPSFYRGYYKRKIGEISEDIKRICFDEFHRTSKAQAVRDQVVVDMREGRKWGVHVVLLSQSIDDFSPLMIEFATSIFILSGGQKQTVEKIAKIFGLSEAAQRALSDRVRGPTKKGTNFIIKVIHKDGIDTQLLTSTIGAAEYWAFSTTVEDRIVRNALYKRLGPSQARKLLSRTYPFGVKSEVERRRNMIKDDGFYNEEAEMGIIDDLIDEIISKA